MKNWIKTFIWLLIILLVSNLLVWLFDKTYVYKAIYHNFASIYDHRIFDNRIIESVNPIPLPIASDYGHFNISTSLESELINFKTTALLILRQDSLLYENYWLSGHKDSVSNSFSMAKTIVGILTGIAIEKGYIKSLDDPAGLYYPPYMENGREQISIRNLLSMSSGLKWTESYYLPISVTTEAYYGTDLPALMDRLSVIESPGKKYKYISSDTQVLGLVISNAAGMSLSEFAAKYLWSPLGAEKNALWSLDKANGTEKAFCCFFATARDFSRIGLLLLNNGSFFDQSVVSAGFISDMTSANALPDNNNEYTDYYGWQIWLLPDYEEYGAYYARGIYGQFIIVIPALEIVVVRLGHWRGAKVGHHWKDVYSIMDELIKSRATRSRQTRGTRFMIEFWNLKCRS